MQTRPRPPDIGAAVSESAVRQIAALNDGYRGAFAVGAAFATVAAVLAVRVTEVPDLPSLDEARHRLARRFGDGVQSWMDELPNRLIVLRERWNLELDSVIPKGSMSVVLRCRTGQGQRAVLKIRLEPCVGTHLTWLNVQTGARTVVAQGRFGSQLVGFQVNGTATITRSVRTELTLIESPSGRTATARITGFLGREVLLR